MPQVLLVSEMIKSCRNVVFPLSFQVVREKKLTFWIKLRPFVKKLFILLRIPFAYTFCLYLLPIPFA